MTHEDAYAGIAERYDLFRGRFGEHGREEMAFFWRLFEKHGVRRVLDCACGTGHDLHLFYLLGCQVMGADISPAMLAQARANLAALQKGISLRTFSTSSSLISEQSDFKPTTTQGRFPHTLRKSFTHLPKLIKLSLLSREKKNIAPCD